MSTIHLLAYRPEQIAARLREVKPLSPNRFWILGIASLLLLTACGPNLASPTPTPAVLGDCFWPATAVAWLDENGNGTWEETERPLAGIEFVLEPSVYSRTTSGADGVAHILATTPISGPTSCDDLLTAVPARVIAVGYAGYELTTLQWLPYVSSDERYEFGFQPVAIEVIPDTTPTAEATEPAPVPAATESAPIFVETEMYEGVIFAAEMAVEFAPWFDVTANAVWTPEPGQIAALEDGLAQFLQENGYRGNAPPDEPPLWERLPAYKRQYLGVARADQQLIFGNFFCDTFGTDWQQTPVIVMDGGDCFFQVTYDVDTDSFVSIMINGEA